MKIEVFLICDKCDPATVVIDLIAENFSEQVQLSDTFETLKQRAYEYTRLIAEGKRLRLYIGQEAKSVYDNQKILDG